ncbi:MAG: HTH-type transcriptional repressor PurR [Chloroflexota bacterium]
MISDSVGQPRRGVTLREVAARAGVSVGTASGVFNSKTGVSMAASTAVLDAAEALGYQPRRRPRSPRRAVEAVGLLAPPMGPEGPHITTSPFYAAVLHGVEQECQRQGLSLVYGMASSSNPAPNEMPRMIRDRHIQGLLVVSVFAPEFYRRLRALEIPFVAINQDPDDTAADVVISADEKGGYLATHHLLAHGHCPPAVISGPVEHTSIRRRLDGYRRALAEHGLEVNPAYIQEGDLGPGGGYGAMMRLLDQSPRPTAVFCLNDMSASGAMVALKERGLAVPNDVSLVGYDGVELSTLLSPPLTTISVDMELLGSLGVRCLLWRITYPQARHLHTQVDVQLVTRQTVRALRRP